MKHFTIIPCEISAPGPMADDLAKVAAFCAAQAGLGLDVLARSIDDDQPVLTLHLGPDEASPDHPVWCLVCRLACLCPQARVGTLVHATDCFFSTGHPASRTA